MLRNLEHAVVDYLAPEIDDLIAKTNEFLNEQEAINNSSIA